jgi:hypothetical protein
MYRFRLSRDFRSVINMHKYFSKGSLRHACAKRAAYMPIIKYTVRRTIDLNGRLHTSCLPGIGKLQNGM